MKKIKWKISGIIWLFILFVSQCSCSGPDGFITPRADSELSDSELHSQPGFWNQTRPSADSSNLYSFTLPDIDNMPFNHLFAYGDRILLAGEGYYESDPDAEDGTLLYSFMVYDPWRGQITAKLEPEQISCTDYAVLNNQLLLINYETCELFLYDNALNKIRSYHLQALLQNSYLRFFPSAHKDIILADDGCGNLYILDISGASLSYKTVPIPLYQAGIQDISPDFQTLLLFGIEPDTLKYTLQQMNAFPFRTVRELPADSYYNGDCSSGATLTLADQSRDLWFYQSQSLSQYFYLPKTQQVTVLNDGSFLTRQELYNYNNEETSAGVIYTKYDSKGQFQSSFTYNYENYGTDNQIYLSDNGVYLEDCSCYFLLTYDLYCHPAFLVWDTSKSGPAKNSLLRADTPEELTLMISSLETEPETSQTDPGYLYGDTITAIPDPQSYDWGELSEVNARASMLEEKYGISIYLGPEIPEMIDIYKTEQCLDAETLSTALTMLEEILNCYPENFFSQLSYGNLKGIRFYICGAIYGETEGMINEPSGFVNEINSYMVMVLDAQYNWDWSYTVNHELSHMIDRRLSFRSLFAEDAVFSEDVWNTYNPDEGIYLETYDGYEDSQPYEDFPDYFIDSYGTTYATEDRAEIFGTAVQQYLSDDADNSYFTSGSPIRAKHEYYCLCIRDGFDTTGWEDTMAWEAILN